MLVLRMLSVLTLIPCTVRHSWTLIKNQSFLLVPPISDRYYAFELLDAYTNDYAYIGQRASERTGGTYLFLVQTGRQVPEGMTKIWTPTNLAWLINRILVKGPSDVPNVQCNPR